MPDPPCRRGGRRSRVAGSAYDPEGDPLTTAWSVVPLSRVDAGAMCIVADPAALTRPSPAPTTGPIASDGRRRRHGPVTAQADPTVGDPPPTVTIVAPVPGDRVVAGSALTVTVAYADPGANDAHISFVEFWRRLPAFGRRIGAPSASRTPSPRPETVIDVVVTDDDGSSLRPPSP